MSRGFDKLIRLVAISLIISGCAAQPELMGTWTLQDSGAGPYSFSQFSLNPGGLKCVVTFSNSDGAVTTDAYLSEWTVVDGVLVTTYGPNTTRSLPPGYVMHDRIDLLTEDELTLFMVQPAGSTEERHRRLPDVEGERVCELARAIILQREPDRV